MSNDDLIKKAKNFILHPNDGILIVIDDEKNWMKTRSLIKAIKNEYINTYRKDAIIILTKKNIKDVNKINCSIIGRSITKVEFRTMLLPEDYKRLAEIIIPTFYTAVQSKHHNLLENNKE